MMSTAAGELANTYFMVRVCFIVAAAAAAKTSMLVRMVMIPPACNQKQDRENVSVPQLPPPRSRVVLVHSENRMRNVTSPRKAHIDVKSLPGSHAANLGAPGATERELGPWSYHLAERNYLVFVHCERRRFRSFPFLAATLTTTTTERLKGFHAAVG